MVDLLAGSLVVQTVDLMADRMAGQMVVSMVVVMVASKVARTAASSVDRWVCLTVVR